MVLMLVVITCYSNHTDDRGQGTKKRKYTIRIAHIFTFILSFFLTVGQRWIPMNKVKWIWSNEGEKQKGEGQTEENKRKNFKSDILIVFFVVFILACVMMSCVNCIAKRISPIRCTYSRIWEYMPLSSSVYSVNAGSSLSNGIASEHWNFNMSCVPIKICMEFHLFVPMRESFGVGFSPLLFPRCFRTYPQRHRSWKENADKKFFDLSSTHSIHACILYFRFRHSTREDQFDNINDGINSID